MAQQWKTPDAKREEFRRYLEKAGILDGLTKILVNLYEEPERPEEPLSFLANQLSGSGAVPDVPALQRELLELREQLSQLQQENQQLRAQLEAREGAASSAKEETS